MIELELPYPPSLNRYLKNWRGRMVKSQIAKDYQTVIKLRAKNHLEEKKLDLKPISEKIAVHLTLHAKDRRQMDLDNAKKVVLDALQTVIYDNDRQIDWEFTERGKITPKGENGKLVVRIYEHDEIINLQNQIKSQNKQADTLTQKECWLLALNMDNKNE